MTKARDLANAADVLDDVSATELSYVNGVTSAIQTQIDGKQAVVSGVNDTEIGYLDGVTSAIQTQLDAKTAKSTLTTTGDIYYASSANTPARLGIGTAGQVLTVNSGATAPEWATPAGGGGMTLIQETTASALSSLDFNSIPGTYKQLLLVWHGLFASAVSLSFSIRFNSSSASEYQTYHGGSQGSNSGYGAANTTTTHISYPDGNIPVTESAVTGIPTVGSLLIDNYASASKHKFYEGRQFGEFSENNGKQAKYFGGTWKNTGAITSVNIFRISASGTFSNNANTSIRLYGIS